MVSDQIDRHFSWNRGNPLHTLLRLAKIEKENENSDIVIRALRQAKSVIDDHDFGDLIDITNLIKEQASEIGLNISNTSTTLDFKDISFVDSRISLHEDSIPFRLKGKGSKRLSSLAIQLVLTKDNGIMLVDEIEQGLEPDRVKNLIRSLKEANKSQAFIATHSRDVITELGAESLCLIKRSNDGKEILASNLDYDSDSLTRVVRACPEAFFAKKIIMCEGATEVGICRALDRFRTKQGLKQLSFKDCAYVDGTGNNLLERVLLINEVGFSTSLLCDSDEPNVNSKKEDFRKKGIAIFDCEENLCIEQQVFNDLPWDAIKELLTYVQEKHRKNNISSLEESIKSKLPQGRSLPENWRETDSEEIRTAIAKASIVKEKEWFKRVDCGEFLGNVIFRYFNEIKSGSKLRKSLDDLIIWIDK